MQALLADQDGRGGQRDGGRVIVVATSDGLASSRLLHPVLHRVFSGALGSPFRAGIPDPYTPRCLFRPPPPQAADRAPLRKDFVRRAIPSPPGPFCIRPMVSPWLSRVTPQAVISGSFPAPPPGRGGGNCTRVPDSASLSQHDSCVNMDADVALCLHRRGTPRAVRKLALFDSIRRDLRRGSGSPLLIIGKRTMPGRRPSRFPDPIRDESVARRRGKLEWRLSSYESRLPGDTPGQIGLDTR